MATMIPDLMPEQIANDGERLFYAAARGLPEEYTVFYSYRYYEDPDEERVREADFIIVHPAAGFVVVEVKEGEVRYYNGQWHEFRTGGYLPLHKDPVEQARTAMYRIRDMYREETGEAFPARYRFALCFPETRTIAGRTPADLMPESLWTGSHLENLREALERLLGMPEAAAAGRSPARSAASRLIELLAPKCNVFASLEDKIAAFRRQSDFVLTEEQNRILEETEEDSRKLFLGAAGTGKTFIAMEKARRCAAQGKRVLLTCYNQYLVGWLRENVKHPNVTIRHFHGFLAEALMSAGLLLPEEVRDDADFYNEELPGRGLDYFDKWPEKEKFDVIIIDEGQDFRELWILCLETALKRDGEMYAFADPFQNLFQGGLDGLRKRCDISRHRLTYNLRNADTINDWLGPFAGGVVTRPRLSNGMPVAHLAYRTQEEERRLLEREIGRLVSQGLPLHRMLILSPYRRENSCLSGVVRLRDWPIIDFQSREHGIRFTTIRKFKGLEADVVFLVDVRDSKACTPADVYVGASRARFMLYVLHHEEWKRPD
jgi:hypothetical protein